MKRKVYKRNYDNPRHADGTEKPNVYLGEFEVLQQISGSEEDYSGQFIVRNVDTGVIYLINEIEVTGFNGGSRYECIELTFLTAGNTNSEAEKACVEFAEVVKMQPQADNVTLRECLDVLQYATYHDGRYGQVLNYEKFQEPAQRLVKRIAGRLGVKPYEGFGA